MEISDLIKSARIEKGLTQQQLAELSLLRDRQFRNGNWEKVFLTKPLLYCYTSIWTSRIMRKNSYQSLFLISKILY